MTANFGGVDVVPLQGAVVVCYGWGEGDDQLWGVDVVPLTTQKLAFAIWGLCWYNFLRKLTTINSCSMRECRLYCHSVFLHIF